MATVFLAPTLQPEQQSPHSVQAGCATPAGLTVSSKLTITGAATGGDAERRARGFERAVFGELLQPWGSGTGAASRSRA